MSLFSSKSKSTSESTTTTTTTDNSQQTSGTVGDLSKGNLIAGQNATMYGYTADDTQGLIDTALDYITRATDDLKEVNSKAINQVQSAYSGANNSILESSNETKAFLSSLKPYAFYAAIVAVAYFVFAKGGFRK